MDTRHRRNGANSKPTAYLYPETYDSSDDSI